jgi:hypothetical protein
MDFHLPSAGDCKTYSITQWKSPNQNRFFTMHLLAKGLHRDTLQFTGPVERHPTRDIVSGNCNDYRDFQANRKIFRTGRCERRQSPGKLGYVAGARVDGTYMHWGWHASTAMPPRNEHRRGA